MASPQDKCQVTSQLKNQLRPHRVSANVFWVLFGEKLGPLLRYGKSDMGMGKDFLQRVLKWASGWDMSDELAIGIFGLWDGNMWCDAKIPLCCTVMLVSYSKRSEDLQPRNSEELNDKSLLSNYASPPSHLLNIGIVP